MPDSIFEHDNLRLVIDGAEMDDMLHSEHGPVAMYLGKLADRIIVKAKEKIKDNPHRRHPPNMTGTLARTLVKRNYKAGEDFGVMVVAGIGIDYAYWVHEGNGPSGGYITPKHASVLAFVTAGARPSSPSGWAAAIANKTAVIVPKVRTSIPNPYLRDAMTEIIASADVAGEAEGVAE